MWLLNQRSRIRAYGTATFFLLEQEPKLWAPLKAIKIMKLKKYISKRTLLIKLKNYMKY
jgi:hypothetical protein